MRDVPGAVLLLAEALDDPDVIHPTWTHGTLADRILSGVTRAERVRHGDEVLGRVDQGGDMVAPLLRIDARSL